VKAHTFAKQYDLIVSNPPFFEHHLRSPKEGINVARHDDKLTYKDLIRIVYRILSPDGCFAVMVPNHQSQGIIRMAKDAGLYLHYYVAIKPSSKHPDFRSICQFSINEPSRLTEKELIIKEGDSYSEEFVILLKDYYLNL
jgi:tRNA1Val (adenine37-N6)-methyltransferase